MPYQRLRNSLEEGNVADFWTNCVFIASKCQRKAVDGNGNG